jgi:hypothetical protein
MIKRIGHSLGWLLAAALLAVGPSVASGSPTAHTAGSGGGGNGGCNDNWPPSSNWGNGWWGHDGQGSYWNGWGDGNGYFNGHASDSNGCGGNGGHSMVAGAAATGKVARVMVAVKRLDGSKCQHLFSSGRLGSAGSCKPTHWMRAKGTSAWRFDIPKELPKGNYQLHREAIDAAGNHEKQHVMHLSIR